ncbi:PEP-CTERM sorting domain-containing protein [Aquisalimonas sp.]|uniref:PEP-CTERM sorting domain-containing protein n=1 Tax=Aquisalimonas sp. TaxID=1872621 RepID=UPI0025C20F80|nr:PEP-CTERM sorting domain-containing protein [Aquisalimonas sp.]
MKKSTGTGLSLAMALGMALGIGASQVAHAVPIVYGFDIDFDEGPLIGNAFSGTFSIDGDAFTRVGTETFTPDGSENGELLSFDITIAGDAFTMEDDGDFPEYPAVIFSHGLFEGMDYLAGNGSLPDSIGRDVLSTDIAGNGSLLDILGLNVLYTDSAGDDSFGDVTNVDVIAEVPNPATLALLGSGLLGLIGVVYRRRTSNG